MNPPPLCVATITTRKTGPGETLPLLSASSAPWIPLLALALVAGGLIALLIATGLANGGGRLSRGRRRRRWIAAGAGGFALIALVSGAELSSPQAAALAPIPPAVSVPSTEARLDTSYGKGCRLFEITRSDPPTKLGSLLPGDTSTLLTISLKNRFSATVSVTAHATLAPGTGGTGGTGGAVTLPVTTRFADASAAVISLRPGHTTTLSVTAAPPSSLGNEAQGTEFVLDVTVTAREITS